MYTQTRWCQQVHKRKLWCKLYLQSACVHTKAQLCTQAAVKHYLTIWEKESRSHNSGKHTGWGYCIVQHRMFLVFAKLGAEGTFQSRKFWRTTILVVQWMFCCSHNTVLWNGCYTLILLGVRYIQMIIHKFWVQWHFIFMQHYTYKLSHILSSLLLLCSS